MNLNSSLKYLADHKGPTITLNRFCEIMGMTRMPAKRILIKLESENLLRRLNDGKQHLQAGERGKRKLNPKWSLVRRQLYKDRVGAKGKPGPLRDKLWRLIRMRPVFTITDLITIGGIEEASCRAYIAILKKYGYIKKVKTTGSGVTWQLVITAAPVKRPTLSEVNTETKESL